MQTQGTSKNIMMKIKTGKNKLEHQEAFMAIVCLTNLSMK